MGKENVCVRVITPVALAAKNPVANVTSLPASTESIIVLPDLSLSLSLQDPPFSENHPSPSSSSFPYTTSSGYSLLWQHLLILIEMTIP